MASPLWYQLTFVLSTSSDEFAPHMAPERADRERLDMARTLALEDISLLALLKLNSGLLDLVEIIVFRVKSIMKILDVAGRVQRLPWICAASCFAGFQHQNQGIETREECGESNRLGSVQGVHREEKDLGSGGGEGLRIKVCCLMRVVLGAPSASARF